MLARTLCSSARHAAARGAAARRPMSTARSVKATCALPPAALQEGHHMAYRVRVDVAHSNHSLPSDEHTEHGGDDTAASPMELLLASVSSCTAQSIRRVAIDNHWEVRDIEVSARFGSCGGTVVQTVSMDSDVSHEVRVNLLKAAEERSSVARLLEGGLRVDSHLAEKDEKHHKGRGKSGKHKKN